MGADIRPTIAHAQAGEPIGTIAVRHGDLVATEIAPEEVPGRHRRAAGPCRAGDARRRADGVRGAQELRVKESDRISALAEGSAAWAARSTNSPDGFHVRGRNRLRGGEVDAKNDHRLAMAFAIAALGASGPTVIHDAGAAAVSYPEFFSVLESLRA